MTIAQGLPKGDKFEWVIQKATELGVKEIILVQSERCIAKRISQRTITGGWLSE